MNSKNLALRIMVGVLLVAVLAGCSSPAPSPTLAPTVDTQSTLDAVKTESVSTAIAELTKNAPAATPTATQTQTPTTTSTPASTNTPLPTATKTATLLPLWTATPIGYVSMGCSVTSVTPAMNTTFAQNTDFDTTWVLKNTGEGNWNRNSVDLSYSSGDKLQKSASVYDLQSDVPSRGSYDATVNMHTPGSSGSYTTTWVLNSSGVAICSMTLTIIVN